MDKEFEYAALRHMVGLIADILERYHFEEACDKLTTYGLHAEQTNTGFLVYPMKSPRKHPACLVVLTEATEWPVGWTGVLALNGMHVFSYRAGDYDLANESPRTSIRAAEKG